VFALHNEIIESIESKQIFDKYVSNNLAGINVIDLQTAGKFPLTLVLE